ncbi:MAG TPA: reverse transcriptase family protein, partial [Bryobacteraceae bacterium]|nr:reverse transcriptase family protein [Bryobacteraceae bacterium]
ETIARAFLAGPLETGAAVERASAVMGKKPRWLPGLARRFVRAFFQGVRPRFRDAVRFLRDDGFLEGRSLPPVVRWLMEPPVMQPAVNWGVPAIVTVGELAAWAGAAVGELEWLADLRGLARPGHYHYQTVAKQSGAVRLLEAPKARLKELQRRILREILDRAPGHEAAHGFRARRSARTFAAVHAGQRVVLRMDLRDFFPSIGRSRVQAIFRMMGYPEAVADLLGGLCTNAAPEGGPLYEQPHLPQGAPTSPALANLCFYRADCRLAGLARAAGLRYARYADDLAFSGDSIADAFRDRVGAIILEEGYCLQYRKTRLMRQGVRQKLAGLVVNERPNVDRAAFDLLKATLHRCVLRGPGEASREELMGRIAWVESGNAGRGRKLRALWDRIDWGARG